MGFGIGRIPQDDDHYGEQQALIKAASRPPRPVGELVKCDFCGRSIPRILAMAASLGRACPDCYDDASDY